MLSSFPLAASGHPALVKLLRVSPEKNRNDQVKLVQNRSEIFAAASRERLEVGIMDAANPQRDLKWEEDGFPAPRDEKYPENGDLKKFSNLQIQKSTHEKNQPLDLPKNGGSQ
jgi:hypothetical protein